PATPTAAVAAHGGRRSFAGQPSRPDPPPPRRSALETYLLLRLVRGTIHDPTPHALDSARDACLGARVVRSGQRPGVLRAKQSPVREIRLENHAVGALRQFLLSARVADRPRRVAYGGTVVYAALRHIPPRVRPKVADLLRRSP